MRHGRDVRLDTSDPDGAWVFLVRPDGSVVEAERFQVVRRARVGDLGNYVRHQGAAGNSMRASNWEAAVRAADQPRDDAALTRRLHDHFGQLTRAVANVPHDPALTDGGTIKVSRLAKATHEAWIRATAAVAEGL